MFIQVHENLEGYKINDSETFRFFQIPSQKFVDLLQQSNHQYIFLFKGRSVSSQKIKDKIQKFLYSFSKFEKYKFVDLSSTIMKYFH